MGWVGGGPPGGQGGHSIHPNALEHLLPPRHYTRRLCYFYYFLTFCLSNLCSLLKKPTISRRKILPKPHHPGQ